MSPRQIDSVIKRFNATATLWNELYRNQTKANFVVLNDRLKFSLDFISKYATRGSKVLDAGCGAGVASLALAKMGFRVVGVDVAPRMIDLCNKNIEDREFSEGQCRFSIADVGSSEFESGEFGAVLAMGFLEYQEDEVAVLRRLYEILAPDGILVCTGPSLASLANYLGLGLPLERLREIIRKENHVSLHHYTINRFKKLLKCSGFSYVDGVRHGYSGLLGLSSLIGFRRGVRMHDSLTKLSRTIPFVDLLANDIIVVGRKKSA